MWGQGEGGARCDECMGVCGGWDSWEGGDFVRIRPFRNVGLGQSHKVWGRCGEGATFVGQMRVRDGPCNSMQMTNASRSLHLHPPSTYHSPVTTHLPASPPLPFPPGSPQGV